MIDCCYKWYKLMDMGVNMVAHIFYQILFIVNEIISLRINLIHLRFIVFGKEWMNYYHFMNELHLIVYFSLC